MRERDLQRQVIEWLRITLPPGSWVGAIPGGDGSRTMAPGYVKGTPDLIFVVEGRAYFIELKGDRGRLSREQIETMDRIQRAGSECATARTLDQVQGALQSWGIRARAST